MFTVVVPGGETAALTLSLSTVGASAPANLQVGSQAYTLTVTDTGGDPVTSFDPPLQLQLTPSSLAMLAAGGDPSLVPVMVLNADTGALEQADVSVGGDGSVSFNIAQLGATQATPSSSE